MLDFTKPPFPESPACKKCLLKPCKRLFSGRVYPGKMIFVRRRDFISLPCHQPNFLKNQEVEKAEEVVLTDYIEVITEKVTVTNPRWEHVDEQRKESSPDVARIGDKVLLVVDVTGIPDKARVTMDVFDVTVDPPMRISGSSGPNSGGTAEGEWTVEDPSERGASLKLEFEGIAKSKASERCPIKVKVVKEYSFSS